MPGVISSYPSTNGPPQTHMHLQSGLTRHQPQIKQITGPMLYIATYNTQSPSSMTHHVLPQNTVNSEVPWTHFSRGRLDPGAACQSRELCCVVEPDRGTKEQDGGHRIRCTCGYAGLASDATANGTNSLVTKGTSNQSTRDRHTTLRVLIIQKVTYTLLL